MKVSIRHNPATRAAEIYFYDDVPSSVGMKRLFAKPIKIEFEEVKKLGDVITPTLIISDTDFLDSLAHALDEQGIKTDKDAKIQGIMEAQKYHLEDMRKLVFKGGEKL